MTTDLEICLAEPAKEWTHRRIIHCESDCLVGANPKEKDSGGESHGPLINWKSLTLYNGMIPDESWLFTICTNRSGLTGIIYNLLSTIFDTLSNTEPESVRVAAFATTET